MKKPIIPTQNEAVPETRPDEYKCGKHSHDAHDWATLSILALTLIAAGFAAGITGWQAVSARQQLAVARDTELRQLRAYVGVESVTLRPLEAGRPLAADLHVKKFGPTPAGRVQVFGQPSAVREPDLSEKALRTFGHTAPESLVPTAERTITVGDAKVKEPDEMQDALHPSKAPKLLTTDLLVYGLVSYRDVSDTTRSTEFCYIVSRGRVGQATSDACQDHNSHN